MGGVDKQLLAQLAAAHAPPAFGWWSPAPGWWLLLVLGLALIVAVVLWLRSPMRRLRLLALGELKQLERAGADDAVFAQNLEHLLRRYAVARFGREPVARLSGERWIDFVAAHGGAALAGTPGRELLRAAYGGKSGIEVPREQWLSGARSFLKGRGKRRP